MADKNARLVEAQNAARIAKNETKREGKGLRERVQHLETTAKAEEDQWKATVLDLTEQIKAAGTQHTDLDRQLRRSQQDLQFLRSRGEGRVDQYKVELAKARSHVATLESTLGETRNRLAKMESRLTVLASGKELADRQNAAYEDKTATLKAEVVDQNELIKRLEGHILGTRREQVLPHVASLGGGAYSAISASTPASSAGGGVYAFDGDGGGVRGSPALIGTRSAKTLENSPSPIRSTSPMKSPPRHKHVHAVRQSEGLSGDEGGESSDDTVVSESFLRLLSGPSNAKGGDLASSGGGDGSVGVGGGGSGGGCASGDEGFWVGRGGAPAGGIWGDSDASIDLEKKLVAANHDIISSPDATALRVDIRRTVASARRKEPVVTSKLKASETRSSPPSTTRGNGKVDTLAEIKADAQARRNRRRQSDGGGGEGEGGGEGKSGDKTGAVNIEGGVAEFADIGDHTSTGGGEGAGASGGIPSDGSIQRYQAYLADLHSARQLFEDDGLGPSPIKTAAGPPSSQSDVQL